MNTLSSRLISDSVDKRVELNKRSLDIRNSGNEKHERHDQLAIMDSCIRTMHTMRGSSKHNCSPYPYMYYNPQHYQLIMTNNTMQYLELLSYSAQASDRKCCCTSIKSHNATNRQ